MTVVPTGRLSVLSQEERATMSEEELLEWRRRKIASMTKQDWADQMREVCEHPATRHLDEYYREQRERKGAMS
jgi:hypothetical protein